MTIRNKNFRAITMSLQIVAIAAYFITPLISGSSFGLFWHIAGIIHTAIFAAVFFRDANTRTALSVVLMIVIVLWCLSGAIFGIVVALLESSLGPMSSPMLYIYIVASLLAIIFALAMPRRFAIRALSASAHTATVTHNS